MPGAQADAAADRGRVTKRRSCNACVRCRRQKIKCSGSRPCDACSKRNLSCDFDERDQKILVTRGYLIDLEQKVENWKRHHGGADCRTPRSSRASQDVADGATDAGDSDDGSDGADESIAAPPNHQSTRSIARSDLVASTLTNPLSTGPSTFMAASDGRKFYLGTSSNWSFTRRLLSMTHEFIYQTTVPSTTLLFDGAAYDLNWSDRRTAAHLETPLLPTLDYAIYLINAVKFHCGQTFHLFDEASFMESLYDFYSDPNHSIAEAHLWYIHFLIILAFGKAFTTQRSQGKRPPGTDFFAKAVQMLPSTILLERQPLMSTEILCCISLYLQCLDYRDAAHNYIGQAMRIALCHGMHTDMPVRHLGEVHVERCRRAWWTTYVLDREMTSLMGLPQSIHDDDVHPDLPTFSGSIQRAAALSMQIKLSRAIARVNRGVYGADGRLNSKFLLSTKEVLASIAHLADELREAFPLQIADAISGISRTYAYLHLLYHQCIVLATRPLLFCFLKIRFESTGADRITLHSSQTTFNLAKMCMESSQQMISILNCVRAQHLLETFLPFDLEAISVSTVNIILAPSVDPDLLANRASWLDRAFAIFDDMASAGNVVAEYRRAELRKLDGMLSQLSHLHSRRASASAEAAAEAEAEAAATAAAAAAAAVTAAQQECMRRGGPSGAMAQLDAPMQQTTPAGCMGSASILPSPISGILDEICFGGGLAGAQIMDTVNQIDSGDNEWMSHEIMEHSIW
ncbi:zn 2cys6 transcription factor [Diplodia corticola]|uniref:Zn 2cys6 transcription factor n=1 Tax=Diplodia corticola TaxID=236234 RepID=A0A1J9R8L7_9PEZI|nr:zn 2cys6 transcription factor [Diplodia corticola]OJD37902.1 zn 2cys6 transcription factor [Diplodia corticola]